MHTLSKRGAFPLNKLVFLIFSIIFPFYLYSSSTINKINFNFDFYLNDPFSNHHSINDIEEKWMKEILEEARILASARVYGYHFSYFYSQTFGDKTKPIINLEPINLIPYGSPQLHIKAIKELTYNHFQVEASYILTNYEKLLYNNYKKLSQILPISEGKEKWDSDKFFFSQALSNSIFNAIHNYAKKKNLNNFQGDVILIKTNPILIKSGFVIQYSQIEIRH